MTQIKVDSITDVAGTGAPDFSDGLTVSGGAISALNTAEYYSSGTEPTSPKNGAIWWDSTNSKVMVYIAAEFKEVELGASSGIDISQASYDSVSFSVASQDSTPFGMAFNTDGSKMYIAGWQYDSVYQYSLSTVFDLSTASYDSVSFSIASQDTVPIGLLFSPDGTKMYIVGLGNKKIFQYSLSTAFNISTASYSSTSFSTLNEDTGTYDMAFNGDGTKMYTLGTVNDSVYQYSLSTAYNVGTSSYDSVSFSVASQETTPQSFRFNSDGTKLFVIGQGSRILYQYSLSTAYDISTASYDSVSFSAASQVGSANGISFSADDTKLYIMGATNDTVYQYSTGL